ncbi:MAG TPA: hypothetical protein VEF04_15735 [Blastocatellia bacterium]|nr:hypothetical protein [Blastocatellia bacterium]
MNFAAKVNSSIGEELICHKALKGRDSIAQGSALGRLIEFLGKPCKGETTVTPLQGFGFMWHLPQRVALGYRMSPFQGFKVFWASSSSDIEIMTIKHGL